MGALSILLTACAPEPEGLRATPPGDGPRIVFDLEAKPLPEIPFPNDIATRPDPSSPTGRRVNSSLIAPTRLEGRFRERVDRLDGFSTFGAISVRFDRPLDVAAFLRDAPPDGDPASAPVVVLDFASGTPVPLDACAGAYPYVLERPSRYYPSDPRAGQSNLVFETVEEDINGNGVLDPGEDSDFDGVLDHPNTRSVGGDPVDDLLTCYERETDTLLLRPLAPLLPEKTYAVVIFSSLVGENAQPVRSPFAYVHHLEQTETLRPLKTLLPRLGRSLEEVAFAWSFTTQSTSRELERLRDGLYGRGPFAWLAGEYPVEVRLDVLRDGWAAGENPFVVKADALAVALRPLASAFLGDEEVVEATLESFRYADYAVMGRIATPQLLRGLEETWDLDENTGAAVLEPADLPFLVVIPRARPERGIGPPYPVAIYLHGTGGSRVEALGFAGQLAKWGIATIGVDLVMHGLVVPDDLREILLSMLRGSGLGAFGDSLLSNRAVDINGDGVPDPAGNFWTYDVFRARDAVRQGALDVMRLVQALRAFDGKTPWSQDADRDGQPELAGLAGDFDGDGRVDLGGPIYLFGISLGGIVTSVAFGVEPELEAAAPISPGAGMIDIALRSLQYGIPEMVILAMMGPLLVGAEDAAGKPALAFHVPDGHDEASVPVHSLEGVRPGDRLVLTNLRNGKRAESRADEGLRFRLALPCDKGDPLRVEAFADGEAAPHWTARTFDREVRWQGDTFAAGATLVALAEGLGTARQTPDLRRLAQVSQMALDAGDPVNYAPLYFRQPGTTRIPEDWRPRPVALLLTAGDMNVPISTGAALGRAAGLIPFARGDEDPRYGATAHRVLERNWVLEGLERLKRFDRPPWNEPRAVLLDADNLSQGSDGFGVPRLDPPLRLESELSEGRRAVVRFLFPSPTGFHGIAPSDPRRAFNVHLFAINALGRFFATGGREWRDDPCLADDSCDFIPR
ncbi:MAG: hypothetical protein GYA21_06135 [Myxococcales bacterium]|nr:hypothetical protein [Myxococcales bacterium]